MRKLFRKIWSIQCLYCVRRFRKEEKFHEHLFQDCQGYKDYKAEQDKLLEKIAPVNRKQRRNMAKKAGQIKKWKQLNG